MIAGTLEVQMLANLARLQTDMTSAKGMIGNVESAAKSLNTALGALGIGLSAVSLVALIKGSIDAMDHFGDLNKTTNITVETLAGLRVAAKQSGGDLDSIATSINKLSVEMGKSPEKFRALGVSAKDPLEAFKQLSDVFVAIENPQQRAAVAAAALGKSWAGAAPLLSEGSAKIAEMVSTGSRLSGVTTEMAQQADALNDKWVLLGGTGGMLTRIVGPILPLLNLLADEMLKASKSADGAELAFSPLKDTLQVLAIVYANLAFMAKTAGNEIGGTAAQVAMVVSGNLSGAAAIRAAMLADAAAAKAELEAFEKKIMGAGLTGRPAPGKPTVDPVAAAAAAAAAAQFLRDDYAARVAVIKIGGEAYAEAIKVTNQLADLAMKEGGIINQRTREELLQQQQTNTADQIFDLMQRQAKIKAIAQQGEQTPGKVKDAAAATAEIEKLNAKLLASEAITQAQIRAERTITAQKQVDDYNSAMAAREQAGAILAESLRSETDRENNEYQNRLINLDVYLASAQGQIADDKMLREALEIQHQQRLLQIERDKHQAERSMQIGTWQLGAELLQQFAGKSKAAAIAVIAINKGLAIAQAIQATAVAVMRAYSDLGPIAGSAAAAGIVALGEVQIGLIVATGLMQAASVGSGGASVGSPSNPISTTPGLGSGSGSASLTTSQPVSQTVINVTFTGNVLSRDFVAQEVAPVLKDLINNSDVTIIGVNSRQAQDLVPA